MPKSATKAVGNAFYEARIEAAKCNDRLASREGAAEELGIDRTRLARIELGSLIPYPEEVLLMAEAYGAPQLTNHYCSSCCPLGKETIPPCELLQIDRLTVKVSLYLDFSKALDVSNGKALCKKCHSKKDWRIAE